MSSFEFSNAITGRDNDLYTRLKDEMRDSDEIRLLVSFIRESGAHLIINDLKREGQRGSKIKILTSDYLNITDPAALYLLRDRLGAHAEIRMTNINDIPFHPKAYFFRKGDYEVLYVGSSNISYSALSSSVEWNYRLEEKKDPNAFAHFKEDFNDLFHRHSFPLDDDFLKKYASNWKKPQMARMIDKHEYIDTGPDSQVIIKPRGAQHEALYELKLAREEGIEKGLVAAATGIGKTYLAAFDSLGFEKILFVAHREEILEQAKNSFFHIDRNRSYSFFKGQEKDTSGDVIFASVQTLQKETHLRNYFHPEQFDYIIVDEFHHAAAKSYLNVLDYFKPRFLLGLTATPYRMDNQDIFRLCNDNLLYELDIKDAINRDLLVPFKYYGIYDSEVDYNEIQMTSGKYVLKDLEKKLSTNRRADLVYKHYKNLAGERTLGFCATIDHARYMAEYFNQQSGIKAATVHSSSVRGEHFLDREKAVKALKEGKIDIIFAVDIFNEGVDIPSLDTVLFLRPTESYVVFLQQLGRGLRKYKDKNHLTVVDFIGNYKRAHYLPFLLAGINPMDRDARKGERIDRLEYPENCQVNIDFRAIDLFEELKKSDPLEQQIKDEFFRLKDELNYRPLRYDTFIGTDLDTNHFLRRVYGEKDGYLRFLDDIGDINSEEKSWLGTIVEDFLIELEKTSMSKSYKMPVLLSFIQNDELQSKVSIEEVGRSFMKFFKEHKLHQKDLNNQRHKGWEKWDLKKFIGEAVQNPVKFLSKREYFIHDKENDEFRLNPELEPYLSDQLKTHYVDIINYRTTRYFHRRFKSSDS